MTFLLDVNVLIALIDPAHVTHNVAHQWFGTVGARDWATCPITENAVVRIVGHQTYPNRPGSPAAVTVMVGRLTTHPGHTFWSDGLSITGSDLIDHTRLLTSAQVTDTYLLALAVAHGGHLATFDRRLSAVAVRGGEAALHLIDHVKPAAVRTGGIQGCGTACHRKTHGIFVGHRLEHRFERPRFDRPIRRG